MNFKLVELPPVQTQFTPVQSSSIYDDTPVEIPGDNIEF